jgi:CDP-diacylglycerol--glycerol-3-phosphate 3-phosphatidyltransferase
MHHLPNILTILRVILIPVFILVYYLPIEWASRAAFGVFFIAALTDYFDGYLARRYQLNSAFGAFLDPVADKLLAATVLIVLTAHYNTIWITLPAVLIIGREIIISALREWMATSGHGDVVAVSSLGKWKTMAQLLAMGFLIYEHSVWNLPIVSIGYTLLYIATFLTVWSMLLYLRAAMPILLKKA